MFTIRAAVQESLIIRRPFAMKTTDRLIRKCANCWQHATTLWYARVQRITRCYKIRIFFLVLLIYWRHPHYYKPWLLALEWHRYQIRRKLYSNSHISNYYTISLYDPILTSNFCYFTGILFYFSKYRQINLSNQNKLWYWHLMAQIRDSFGFR